MNTFLKFTFGAQIEPSDGGGSFEYPLHLLVGKPENKTRPYITERLLMGCKESNQTTQSYLPRGLL